MHTRRIYIDTWFENTSYQVELSKRVSSMSVANGPTGQVLGQPFFRGPNLHAHLCRVVDLKIVATGCVIAEKLPKATLYPDLHHYNRLKLCVKLLAIVKLHLVNTVKIKRNSDI